jgi:nucleoside-diphosphate-sugar epimerase
MESIMSIKPISNEDLKETLKFSKNYLYKLQNKKIFISGATGFFGKWLMQILLGANDEFKLNIKMTILTRNSDKSRNEQRWLNNSNITMIEGDICNFPFPVEIFDFFIHAATSTSASLNNDHPEVMADTIIDGTRNILKLASLSHHPRFLFVSSGAIYGSQPPTILKASEKLESGPLINRISSSYAEAKRMAELYCQFSQSQKKIQLSIARCYAFVGPYLPLDQHFAVGNFINNVLEKKSITLTGDGSPFRTYMYASDLVEWLLAILTEVNNGEIYNVGSDEEIQIIELARVVDNFRFKNGLSIDGQGVILTGNPSTTNTRNAYVPSIECAKKNLKLKIRVSLEEALDKTFKWNLQS